MAERIVNGFKRLFEVRLLHHYWLDDGLDCFDTLPDIVKNKRLLSYDSRNFATINPTASTQKKLSALGGVFRNTALGLLVAIPKDTLVADNETFTFTISITDPDFNNYTALSLLSRKIIETYLKVDENTKTFRYKENVPVFSNLTGSKRGTSPNKTLFLSNEIPSASASDKVEFLNITSGELLLLISSQPLAETQKISSVAANMPVFFNQLDSPLIVPPFGVSGSPEKGILLDSEIPDDVFGLIRITAKNNTDPDFSCTNAGMPKAICPVFQIRLKNRSAVWKYINKNTSLPITESSEPLPLTYFGNPTIKPKPSGIAVKAQFEDGDTTKKITQLYIEIYE
ncbi:MAG: hypothetical protein ACOYN4_13950 [Bacteroidales bacterium]